MQIQIRAVKTFTEKRTTGIKKLSAFTLIWSQDVCVQSFVAGQANWSWRDINERVWCFHSFCAVAATNERIGRPRSSMLPRWTWSIVLERSLSKRSLMSGFQRMSNLRRLILSSTGFLKQVALSIADWLVVYPLFPTWVRSLTGFLPFCHIPLLMQKPALFWILSAIGYSSYWCA